MPQFLIRDADLKNLYDCIKGHGEVSDALLLLSKPQDEAFPRERVYNDVLILTLTDDQLEELVTSIAEENESSSIMVTLSRSVKNGLAVRGEEDSEDDEDDDVEVYQKTLIKVQALAVYAQEEEERFDSMFKRRFK
mgnify:CR=1 FL=1